MQSFLFELTNSFDLKLASSRAEYFLIKPFILNIGIAQEYQKKARCAIDPNLPICSTIFNGLLVQGRLPFPVVVHHVFDFFDGCIL
jgi:hypothetical protein